MNHASDIRLTKAERLTQSFHDFSGVMRSEHPVVINYVASSNRVEQERGRYKDIIFDDLLRYIRSYFKIEHINNKNYLDRSNFALYPSQMTTTGIYLYAGILSRLSQPQTILQIADKFDSIIQGSFPSSYLTREDIRKILILYFWRKKLFGYLLNHLKPKVLLLQTAYTNHALVAAAKELKIKVIEFQHGIIDRHHPGYSWTGQAVIYKNQMAIPDSVFVDGDYWRQELFLNGFWNEE